MNEKEYRELIDELGLSQISIAEILDIAERTSRG
jgi:predicted transcriptional regulator